MRLTLSLALVAAASLTGCASKPYDPLDYCPPPHCVMEETATPPTYDEAAIEKYEYEQAIDGALRRARQHADSVRRNQEVRARVNRRK